MTDNAPGSASSTTQPQNTSGNKARDWLAQRLLGYGQQQPAGAPYRTVGGESYGVVPDSPNAYPSWYQGPRGQDQLWQRADPPPTGAPGAATPQAPNFNWTSPWSYYYTGPTRGTGTDYRTFVRDYAMANQYPEMYTDYRGKEINRSLDPFKVSVNGQTLAKNSPDRYALPNLGWFDEQGNVRSGFENQVRTNEQQYYEQGFGNQYDQHFANTRARERRLDRGE